MRLASGSPFSTPPFPIANGYLAKAVATFVADSAVRDDIRGVLRTAPDMSRALARLSVGRGFALPRWELDAGNRCCFAER